MRKLAPVNEPDIAGYLQIKRKMFWVIRYAEIVNNSFYYYYNKGDSKPRGVFSLFGSKSIDQQGPDNEYIIQFTASKLQQYQKILIRCDKSSDHHDWLNKLIILSQVPQNYGLMSNNKYLNLENQVQSSQSLMKYKMNQGYDSYQRSEVESLNLEQSNHKLNYPQQYQQHLYGNQSYDNILQMRSGNGNMMMSEPNSIIQYVQVQQDSCKSNPYLFDNNFLTEKNPNSSSILHHKKNLMTILENNFKDCDILSDVDKNIRLMCSKTAIEARHSQESSSGISNRNKNSSSNEEQGLMSFINQYFDSPQLKIAMIFVTVILALILYQGLSILDAKNLLITLLIILNFIMLPLLARKINEVNYQNQKKKMKQQRYGVIAEFYFPHNVNEILYALTKQFEKRKDWQLAVQKCEAKVGGNANEYTTTYYRGEPETFTQNVIRVNDIIYLTEENSHGFHRIFSMPINSQQEDGVNVKYYFYSPYTKLSDMKNNPNSPLLLYGLNFYLKQQKRNPFSSLFTYYNKSLEQASSSQAQIPNQKGFIKELTNNDHASLNGGSVNTTASNKNIEVNEITSDVKQMIKNDKNEEKEEQKVNKTSAEKQGEIQEESKSEDSYLLEGENGKKYNAKIEDLIKLMKTQVTLDPSNQWKVGDNKPDYKTHTKIDEATGSIMSRGEVNIKKPAQEIVDYIQDASQRKNWDEMFKSGKEIEKLNDKCRIEHNIFNGIFPVADRDFCLLQISLKLENTYYLLATSIQHPKVPEVSKPVRASLKIGGWVITPISQNESNCVYLTCSDLNGSILQSIKDSVAKKQSMNAVKLKKKIEK